MARYHVRADGQPGICKAKNGHCPLGDKISHFDTVAEAQKYSDNRQLEKFLGIEELPKPDTSMVDEKVLDSNNYVQEFYHDKADWRHGLESHQTELVLHSLEQGGYNNSRAGLNGETYVGVAYAQDMRLGNTITVNQKGTEKYAVIMNSKVSEDDADEAFSRNSKAVVDKLAENGTHIDGNSLIRAMHFSDDGKTAVIQMGASNVPDLAIVKDGNVEFVEVKDLSSSHGSQTTSQTAPVGNDNRAQLDTSNMPQKVINNLETVGYQNTINQNQTLNQLTYNDGLQFFVEQQQKEGNSHFTYIGRDMKVHDISMIGDKEDIANKMEENNIIGTLRMRSNMIVSDVSPETLNHWKQDRAKQYFKNGEWPESDKVSMRDFNLQGVADPSLRGTKLKDFRIRKGQCSVIRGRLCIGEMMLPVKLKSLDDLGSVDFDQDIDMSKVKARQMTLIGSLRQTASPKK